MGDSRRRSGRDSGRGGSRGGGSRGGGGYGGGSYGGGSRDGGSRDGGYGRDRNDDFGGSRRFSQPREMHKAKCAECGSDCEVPFKPVEDRPVYCRECFAKHRPQRF